MGVIFEAWLASFLLYLEDILRLTFRKGKRIPPISSFLTGYIPEQFQCTVFFFSSNFPMFYQIYNIKEKLSCAAQAINGKFCTLIQPLGPCKQIQT